MPSALSSIQPTGRGELLLWLNSVCTAQYPAVECLRDGVAYCALIDAAASRAAENCTALGTDEAPNAQARRRRAAQLLEHLDWDVTLTTCTNVDPSLDSLHVRGLCEKNMQTLQLMLRDCVPCDYALEINVSRLTEGKLQDHVSLLKWMYQFMTKMLNTYSRTALERRLSSSGGSGCVTGLRMTRSMQLKQRMVREKYSSPTSCGMRDHRKIDNDNGSTFRGSGKERPGLSESLRSTEDDLGTGSCKTDPLKKTVEHATNIIDKRTQLSLHEQDVQSPNQCNKRQSFDYNQEPTLLFSVCKEFHSLLVDLRRDVEEFEELTVAANTRHQRTLTYSMESPETSQDNDIILSDVLGPAAPMISLKQLGTMLEERDRLWQTFDLLRDALIQYGFHSENRDMKTSKDTTNISPLVAKIMALISS